MFQNMIIRVNQQRANFKMQVTVLVFQFFIIFATIVQALYCLQIQSGQNLQFKQFSYFSIIRIVELLKVSQITVLSVLMGFNISYLGLIIASVRWKRLDYVNHFLWQVYPFCIQWLIIQNGVYAIINSENIILGSFSFVTTIIIGMGINIYSFRQSDSLLLIRMQSDKMFVPMCQIFLSSMSGLMFQYTQVVQPYLVCLLIYDIYYGPKFFFSPISEFQILLVNKYMKCASFIRIPFILLVLIFQDLRAFTIAMGFTPLILKVCIVTLDRLSLTVIFQTNGYLQQICAEKGQTNLRNNLVESYISYFFDVINLPEPRNRVLMLSLFCNHMSICANLKCYCQNKKFVDTINVTSQLDLDIKQITQQINYQIGATQIKDCYEYLILLFVDNYLKKIKKDELYERLIIQLTLLEIQKFQWRLFQTKIRFKKLKANYHRFHPVMIQRQGCQILTNQTLKVYLLKCNIVDKINMREIINYQRNLELISQHIIKVSKMKLDIFDIIRQNYQSPVPYLLHQKTLNYLKCIHSLEYKIIKIAGKKMKTQLALNLISTFYSFIKVDYQKRNSYSKKMEFHQENDLNCAYVISEFNGKQLIIKEFSENFLTLISKKQSIQGAEVEVLVPKFLHDFHQKTIQSLVTSGQTSLLTSDFRTLTLSVNQYIKQVDILVRVNYQSLQKLQILAFVKDLDKNEVLIIASIKGNIETFTKKAGKGLKLDKIMIANLNLFYLNSDIDPNVKGNSQIEGFLLIPKVNNLQLKQIQYYKYFLNKPKDCYIFYINATYCIQQHGNIQFYCFKVHTFYNLKANNFKYVALDIAFKQVMLKNHLRTERYHTTVESQKQIQYFQKFHSAQESCAEIVEDCDDVESSEHGIPQLKLQPAPEFISSLICLDSNRNQQTKQLISMEQPTDNNNPPYTKRDVSFDSENKISSHQQINKIPLSNQDFTVQISPDQNNEAIELIIELDNQNIYEQIQIISQQMKFKDKQKESKPLIVRKSKRKQTAISSTLSEGRLNSYSMITRMINIVNHQEQQDVIQLKYASLFVILVNIAFVLAFVINMISEFRGVQRDSVNQSYPLILYQDINAVLISINLQELDRNKYLNLSKELINLSTEQYENQSIFVNDLQMDYHVFLQLLDETYISVNQSNITQTYIEKYFFKQFMIEQLRTINGKQITDFRGIEESLLIYNYVMMATELLYLKEHTTDDVIGRIDQMNQLSIILLFLSIFFNILALSLFTLKSCMISNWRNRLTNTMFLFPNLTSFTSILADICHSESEPIDKKQQQSNEIENIKLKQTHICYLLLVTFILLILSLGFYFPLFLYVQSQQDQTMSINQVMTELTLMQLGMSTKFSTILLTYINPNIITDHDIFNKTFQFSEDSERLILYSIPFDSNYNDFPILQQYSQISLCNCSLIDGQLQNGYNGFLQYTKRIINSIGTIDHNFNDIPQFQEIFQSYIIVFQYQIRIYQELLAQINQRTDTVINTLTLITIISQLIIIIIQITTLLLYYRTQVELIKNGKELLYLFTPPIINANKYIHQTLMKITQI